jgi:hypothetical protein
LSGVKLMLRTRRVKQYFNISMWISEKQIW